MLELGTLAFLEKLFQPLVHERFNHAAKCKALLYTNKVHIHDGWIATNFISCVVKPRPLRRGGFQLHFPGIHPLPYFSAHLEIHYTFFRHMNFFTRLWIVSQSLRPGTNAESTKPPDLHSIAQSQLVNDGVNKRFDGKFNIRSGELWMLVSEIGNQFGSCHLCGLLERIGC